MVMVIKSLFKINYINHKIWIFTILLGLLKFTISSSIESCLSAYSININTAFNQNTVLPIDCKCSNTDLACTNLRIYDLNPTDSQLAFPSLNILFIKQNNSFNYILPKTIFKFFGYKNLISNAFNGVKFVDLDNSINLCNQSIYIDFLETTFFPSGVFDRFGNLENISRNSRPKLFLTIKNEEHLSIKSNLTLETNSFGSINIEKLSFKYPQPQLPINSNAFLNSTINTLEIKQSTGFSSFTETFDFQKITVRNLIIDECNNFFFNNKSIPSFDGLTSLSILKCGLREIPSNIWSNYKSLKALRISGNQLETIDQSTLKGLENSLETLDLSNNSVVNIEWKAFQNFANLKSFDFSDNPISIVQSLNRSWPNPYGIEIITLKGYKFDNNSICQFKIENDNQKINLSKTFIELDPNHVCNCFVYFIYKDYRISSANGYNHNNIVNKAPSCYNRMYTLNPDSIKTFEDSCNFPYLFTTLGCGTQTTTTITSTVSTPCYSTPYTTPGLTTITIGNRTTITTTSPSVTTKIQEATTNYPISMTSTNFQTSIITTITDCFTISNNRQNTTRRNTSNELNTPTIIVIAVLVALAFLLMLIIIGLIIYFKTRIFKSNRELIIKPSKELPTSRSML